MITTEQIKELRDKTGISVMVCKNALEKAEGDMNKAISVLREEGLKVADKKSDRSLKAGLVESYIHATGIVGVLMEAKSETDFVSRNTDFRVFAHDVAIHIAASDPVDVEALLKQPYVKNSSITVDDYVKEMIQKFGENIEISRFVRYDLS